MDRLPFYGVGVSYRPRWRQEVVACGRELDCLEIIAEQYVDAPRERQEELAVLRNAFPILPHGIGLSFGTDAPLDPARLDAVARLVEEVRAPWFSEHVAFTGAHGRQIGHLAPLPFTRDAVRAVCANVARWRERLPVPLLLENISYLVALPGEMSEAQFLTEVVERSGCGLLLDLHNVYSNALNHAYDPERFLDALPLERVAQVHLAGGHDDEGVRVNSHSAPVPEPVWELLAHLVSRATPNAVIVEWDTHLPPFDVILAEVARARSILAGAACRC